MTVNRWQFYKTIFPQTVSSELITYALKSLALNFLNRVYMNSSLASALSNTPLNMKIMRERLDMSVLIIFVLNSVFATEFAMQSESEKQWAEAASSYVMGIRNIA